MSGVRRQGVGRSGLDDMVGWALEREEVVPR